MNACAKLQQLNPELHVVAVLRLVDQSLDISVIVTDVGLSPQRVENSVAGDIFVYEGYTGT
jgi:hypothetical protein